MRFPFYAMAIPALLVCSPAVAQMGVTVAPTLSIGTTSPLDMSSGTSVGGTGIPLGSTEINSAGVSPAPLNPTGTIAIPSSGMPCTTLGTSSAGMYGSTATYDGGGMTPGASMPASAPSASAISAPRKWMNFERRPLCTRRSRRTTCSNAPLRGVCGERHKESGRQYVGAKGALAPPLITLNNLASFCQNQGN